MTTSSSSSAIFSSPDLPTDQSANIQLRTQLMLEIKSELETREMTQVEAATLFGVSQPRVSDLLCGRLDKFTLDTLINWLSKLGKRFDLVVLDKGINHFQGGKYAR